MPSFPVLFESTITRIGPSRATVAAPPREPLVGGPPPELRGDPMTWSPEHLQCAALGLCLFATFEALASRDKLDVIGWRDTVTGTLDRTATGLAFTGFSIAVEITVARDDVERARLVLDRAKQGCIITKALAVPVVVEVQVWEHDQRAHA